MDIRAKKSFPYTLADGRERRVPRGWVGELPDDIAEAAVAAGHAVKLDTAAKTEAAEKPAEGQQAAPGSKSKK